MKEFIKNVFSDNGIPSSSRILAATHSLAAVFALLFYVVKTHSMPDGTALGGLGAFATSPYLVNKAGSAIESFSKKDKTQDGDK
jgi:hypothetical protein